MLVRQPLDACAQGIHLNVATGRALRERRADNVRDFGEVFSIEAARREGRRADTQTRGDGRRADRRGPRCG